jgi:hypothetical protein
MPYEENREIQGFEEVFWYSGWIMCGVRRVYCHMPERVLRLYGYVQTVLRHPTDVAELHRLRLCRHLLTFALTRLMSLIGVNWQKSRHGV